MDKRFSKRIPARLEAYIFSGNKTYVGFIENVSENGFQFLIVASSRAPREFKPGKIIQIYFQLPSGETLKLFCEVKWHLTNLSDGKTTLGIKIIEASPKFGDFIKTLDIVNVN